MPQSFQHEWTGALPMPSALFLALPHKVRRAESPNTDEHTHGFPLTNLRTLMKNQKQSYSYHRVIHLDISIISHENAASSSMS